MSKKSLAFTLSEVLLTMTVVGVVAAMTIPTLHYQKVRKEYTAKLKNFYSHMENAILDMQAEKGSFKDMSKPGSYHDNYLWYLENIDPYYGHAFVKDNGDSSNNKVYLKDGSMITQFYPGGCLDIDYDINGDKGPNAAGRDRFRFLFCFTDASRTSWFGNKEFFFGPYCGPEMSAAGTSRQALINQCKSSKMYCTCLLQNDQWEFKDDYPLPF